MRPNKNIVYCCACQKPKMLFETKQKADNFIKYNSKEILEENGKAPIRSYHCMMCGGFHLTSNPSLLSAKRFEKRDMKRLEEISSHKHNNEIDEVNTIIRTFYERIQKIRQELYFGISEESKKLLELCRMDLKQLTELPVRNSGRLFSALAHANINVKMIDQGSSELNIIIGVRNRDFENAIRAIYDIFVKTRL